MINSQIGYHTFDCGEASLIAFDDYASDPVIKSHISSNRDPALFEGIITSWFFLTKIYIRVHDLLIILHSARMVNIE